jgi:AmiR/NasT family two-component response regulator
MAERSNSDSELQQRIDRLVGQLTGRQENELNKLLVSQRNGAAANDSFDDLENRELR